MAGFQMSTEANPHRINDFGTGVLSERSPTPRSLKALFRSGEVRAVVLGGAPAGSLDERTIREIVGERFPVPGQQNTKTKARAAQTS
jgi:hypothetical protein